MPTMGDPRFIRSVVYICAHNADGALGLIINKKMNSPSFSEILEQLEIPAVPDKKIKLKMYTLVALLKQDVALFYTARSITLRIR